MRKTLLVVFIVSIFFFHCAPGNMRVSTAPAGNTESYIGSMARGMHALEQKKYDDAIEALQQATILKPDSEKAHNFLGIAYFMKKDFAHALPCFQNAIRLSPAYTSASCNLGNLQFEMGEVDAAVATLKQALAGSTNDVTLNFSLGNILLHKGEFDSGFIHLKKVMELDPGYLERERKFSLGTSAGDLPRSEMSFRYARLYAAVGNLEKTLEYLENAKKTGFFEWERIRHDDAFAGFRDDPQIKKYFD